VTSTTRRDARRARGASSTPPPRDSRRRRVVDVAATRRALESRRATRRAHRFRRRVDVVFPACVLLPRSFSSLVVSLTDSAPTPPPILYRFVANALIASTKLAPTRVATTRGGALVVLAESRGLQIVERDGLVLAMVSSTLTATDLLSAYDATDAPTVSTGARVNSVREALGELHVARGAFAVVAYDADAGRVLAARTANAAEISYGFAADGSLVVASGISSDALGVAQPGLEMTRLPSGRFVFGHRYVKPIEFTSFWASARANRSGANARAAPASADFREIDAPTAKAPRAGTTDRVGSLLAPRGGENAASDAAASWMRRSGSAARLDALVEAKTSAGAYMPPALRRVAAEKEAAKAAAAAAAAAAEAPKTPSSNGAVSPRTAAKNIDAQVAAAIATEDALVDSLKTAFYAAVESVSRRNSLDARRDSLDKSSLAAVARERRVSTDARPAALSRLSLDNSSWERALSATRSMDRCGRNSMEVSARSRGGSVDVRASMEVTRPASLLA
jgi:hypothetical protein